MRQQITERERYMDQLFAPEDEWHKKIRSQLALDGKEGINVGPTEGKILHFLMRLIRAQRVVEVGCLYGYSALWIARALEEGGRLISLEANADNFARAKELLSPTEVADRIEIRLGDARSTLNEIQGPVDAIFIDADKSSYGLYLDWAEKNVRKGGLIIGDNTFLWGHVYGQGEGSISKNQLEAMQSFNHRLADPERYCSVLLPTAEGLTVAQKLF